MYRKIGDRSPLTHIFRIPSELLKPKSPVRPNEDIHTPVDACRRRTRDNLPRLVETRGHRRRISKVRRCLPMLRPSPGTRHAIPPGHPDRRVCRLRERAHARTPELPLPARWGEPLPSLLSAASAPRSSAKPSDGSSRQGEHRRPLPAVQRLDGARPGARGRGWIRRPGSLSGPRIGEGVGPPLGEYLPRPRSSMSRRAAPAGRNQRKPSQSARNAERCAQTALCHECCH